MTFIIIILFPQSQELTKKLSLLFKSEIKNNYIKISFIGFLIGLMVVYTTLKLIIPKFIILILNYEEKISLFLSLYTWNYCGSLFFSNFKVANLLLERIFGKAILLI